MSPRLSLLILMLAGPVLAAEKPFFFQKGDQVLFLGDSITEQYQYSTYMELYLTTRFPDWGLSFLNAGISGDTATGGAGRFQAHVLEEKPTAITINFGMNDAGYGKFDPARQKQFLEKTEFMLEKAKQAGVRVALVSPNAVDRRGRPNFAQYVETQKEFYAPLKDLAEKHGVSYVDQYAITRAAVERMETDKADKVIPYPDGFHTGPPGGLLMAHAILTGLGAPSEGSRIEINLQPGQMQVAAQGCQVNGIKRQAGGFTFEYSAASIPMPVLKEWTTILPYVQGLRNLNSYTLTVKGMEDGDYNLTIDGQLVTKVSAKDLAEGINLGDLTSGPLHEQGWKVFQAIQAKNQIVHSRFRGVVMFQAPDWLQDVARDRKPMELAKRRKLIDEKQAEIVEMAKPVKRTIGLAKLGS